MSKFEEKTKSFDQSEGDVKPESSDNVKTDNKLAPEGRFQKKQTVDAVDPKPVSADTNQYAMHTSNPEFTRTKQGRISEIIADGKGSGSTFTPSRVGLRTLSYSGDSGSILGNSSRTPVVGAPSRSEGRFGKKLDPTVRKIDTCASEQSKSSYKTPAPLSESGDKVQGYYGTPKNDNIRVQKSAHGTPANILVERSADEISRDMLFYSQGQYIWTDALANDNSLIEPTISTTFSNNGVREEHPLAGDDAIHYSNYANRAIEIIFARDNDNSPAYVSNIAYITEDLNPLNESQQVADLSATHILTDMNKDELTRQSFDEKAGQETEPTWSPLGRAITQPSQTVGLLSRLENDTGAVIATAYRFLSKGLSYQQNKAAKDGQRLHVPVREMFIGDISANESSQDFSADTDHYIGYNNIFDREVMARGCASIFIAIDDTTAKYNTRGDLLSLPKSVRKLLGIAKNNMGVFRTKQQFLKTMYKEDVFSTIGGEYDPYLPVYITDKVGLISNLSYDRFGSFDRDGYSSDPDRQGIDFEYCYSNRSSNYIVTVTHPLLRGIENYLNAWADKFYRVLSESASEGTKKGFRSLQIPIQYATTTITAWECLVCAATPYIQRERINAMRDILDYEDNFGYPFDLVPLSEEVCTASDEYTFTSVDEPLKTRVMTPDVAITWIYPEFHWLIKDRQVLGDVPATVLPWYFSEVGFNSYGTGHEYAESYSLADDPAVMSLPTFRSGITTDSMMSIYDMDERELRLCLDRMTRPVMLAPGSTTSVDHYNVYKYGQANDGIPVVTSSVFTVASYLAVPRELGLFCVAPHGFLRNQDNLEANSAVIGYETYCDMDTVMGGDTSYRLRCWHGHTAVNPEILGVDDVKINRGQSFFQYWDCSPASLHSSATSTIDGYRVRRDVGFFCSMRQGFTRMTTESIYGGINASRFIPFTVGYHLPGADGQATVYNISPQSTDSTLHVYAFHKSLWGRVQRLAFAISPWDTCDYSTSGDNNTCQFDPYDFMYIFGCSGFMASDYNEDIYNKMNIIQQQGYLYTSDPFINDTPILK